MSDLPKVQYSIETFENEDGEKAFSIRVENSGLDLSNEEHMRFVKIYAEMLAGYAFGIAQGIPLENVTFKPKHKSRKR